MKLTIGPFTRVVLLGGGELLLKLHEWAAGYSLEPGIITSPRHAAEHIRGETLKTALDRAGARYIVAERLDAPDVVGLVGDPKETMALSIGAPWIFSVETVGRLFGGNLFNVHGTRLPQNRGGGGFSWQILTGNRFGFCLVHSVDAGIDTGDIVSFEEFLYPAFCRIPADYQSYYVEKTVAHIGTLLTGLKREARTFETLAQPEYLSSYWPRLHTETHGWVDWTWEPQQIERFICAFDDPYSGAQTHWNGVRVAIKKGSLNLQDGHFHPFQSGLVYRVHPKWICVALGGAALVIEEIFDEHGRPILDRVKAGDRLHTPQSLLEDAAKRATYGPRGLK
ncbi:MAG: hypothetical protein A3F69_02270 [Acidobacteria bacterium RIFCSPLOWO2_12_FULL_66_10]|nr:MAG: hypothetical protein A3F69_02270 [Acidobacteria bacterium RIFCSPLOWO2_12_FULL_66_10]